MFRLHPFATYVVMLLSLRETSCIEVNLAVDDMLDFYVDGNHIGQHLAYQTATVYTISDDATVYAIRAQNYYRPNAGLVGSFSTGELTGSTWKCTGAPQADLDWTEVDFNDSDWPAAYAIEKKEEGTWQDVAQSVDPDAYWIWTKDWNLYDEGDMVVYCRKKRGLDVYMAADDEVEIYADGVYIGTHLAYQDATNYTVPYYTSVIAVRGRNWYRPDAGLVGSFSNGQVTGADWRCTNVEEDGWEHIGFDDSAWPEAYSIEPLQGGTWPWYPGNIDPSSFWIWTEDWNLYDQGDLIVYCRMNVY